MDKITLEEAMKLHRQLFSIIGNSPDYDINLFVGQTFGSVKKAIIHGRMGIAGPVQNNCFLCEYARQQEPSGDFDGIDTCQSHCPVFKDKRLLCNDHDAQYTKVFNIFDNYTDTDGVECFTDSDLELIRKYCLEIAEWKPVAQEEEAKAVGSDRVSFSCCDGQYEMEVYGTKLHFSTIDEAERFNKLVNNFYVFCVTMEEAGNGQD